MWNWCRDANIWVKLTAAALAVTIVIGLSSIMLASANYESSETRAAQRYHENAKAGRNKCLAHGKGPAAFRQCVDQSKEAAKKTYADYQKENADAHAARLALIGLVLNFFQVAFSGATIIGLILSISQGHRSVKAAEVSTQTALNAMHIDHVLQRALMLAEKDSDVAYPDLKIRMRNHGASFAQLIGHHVDHLSERPDRDAIVYRRHLTTILTRIVSAGDCCDGIMLTNIAPTTRHIVGIMIYADYRSEYEFTTFRFDRIDDQWQQKPGYWWNAQHPANRREVDERNGLQDPARNTD